jgi:hypothetical protein
MTIGVLAISEGPLAAQADAANVGRRPPPPKRVIVATSDTVVQPEPR